MSQTSIYFVLFFICVILVYYILPFKLKKYWVLLSSLVFYFSFGIKAFFVLIFIIIASFFGAILIYKSEKTFLRRFFLISTIVLFVLILGIFKYVDNYFILFKGSELISVIGMSFFTLQAIGYLSDVYMGKIKATKNVIDYSIFLSFFPYIVSGPIERANNILPQIKKKHTFNYDSFVSGLRKILIGFLFKLIIAERLSIITQTIFNDYTAYTGIPIILGVIAYSFQIYFDFAGYSYIAIGSGEAMGFKIMENFKQPYFSKNISEFWSRWHVSLSSWLKDYIYIPLGGNRLGKPRKYLNIIIVFFVSGVWHGASIPFLIWGLLHGVYQMLSSITKDIRNRFTKFLKINTNCFSYRLWQRFITFSFVSFAWIFFRSESIKQGIDIIIRGIKGFSIAQTFGSFDMNYYSFIPAGLFLN